MIITCLFKNINNKLMIITNDNEESGTSDSFQVQLTFFPLASEPYDQGDDTQEQGHGGPHQGQHEQDLLDLVMEVTQRP